MINTQRYSRLARKNLGFMQNFFNLGFIQASNAVVQILLFPLIIRIVGLDSFGYVAVASTYAGLMAMLINYGTNLSGIKDIALAKKDPARLSMVFFSIYHTRVILFICSLSIPLVLYGFDYAHTEYIFFATAIVFAEVLNPLFFFNGIEKLFLFNCANLFAKLLSAALIIFFVNESSNAAWVNFYLGIGNAFFYCLLTFYAIKKYGLIWKPLSANLVSTLIKENFYLVSNNIASLLQQSLFLFLISFSSSPLTLGAYSLCDKILWSFRLLIIAFSSAIYPKASISYHEKKEKWSHYKKKINGLLAVVFIVTGAILYFFAPLIVTVFIGSNDELAETYIRSVCMVPLLAALNALNVMELLISNNYRNLFYCSLALMSVSVPAAFLFSTYAIPSNFGYYALLTEACSLLLFLAFIHRSYKTGQPSA